MSYTLLSLKTRKAMKSHVCIWCGQKIEPRMEYLDERSVYDNQIYRQRWHPECHDAAGTEYFNSGEEEFTPWDNERPTIPTLTATQT